MTLLTVLVFLAILIIGHELGHFLVAKRFGVRVDEFGFGLPPRIASRKTGETRFSLNLLPLGGFVKIHGQEREEGEVEEPHRAFVNQPPHRRALILIAGVSANLLIGWIALSLVFAIGSPPKVFISEVIPGSAAEAAGLQFSDELKGFASTEEFVNFVQSHRGEAVTINDKSVTVPKEGVIGVRIDTFQIQKEDPFQAVVKGLKATAGFTIGVIKAVANIVIGALEGDASGLKQAAGPVGIFNIIKNAEGAVFLIYLLGVISINLAIFNLLPIPALDGGHLLLLGIEKITGRPVSRRTTAISNAVGWTLLILLMIVITFRDIMRLS